MAKYRKRPVVIEAIQLTDENVASILEWSTNERPIVVVWLEDTVDYAEITTLEGTHRAEYWDWIIRGVKSEVYPCKPDIFEMTYEAVEGDTA